MNKKTAFLIILALIVLYSAIGYTSLPYKGVISIVIIFCIAVVVAKTIKKKEDK